MISPKEKADELVKKIYNTEHCGIEHFPNKRYCDCTEMNLYQAKQCALIAVEEIIAQIEPSVSMDVISARINYWQEVKQEIEKITLDESKL
jgi:hypothetical protein